MRRAAFTLCALLAGACGKSSKHPAPPPDMACPGGECGPFAEPQSKIEHLVVIVQENHSFDNYFGQYCTAATGSNPTCTQGRGCCEKGPTVDPGSKATPQVLDDSLNGSYSPNHDQDCELAEMDGGKMDGYVTNGCGSGHNFSYADPKLVMPYWTLADKGALADHYFQPVAGASSSNNMYLARAKFVFLDNDYGPEGAGKACSYLESFMSYDDQTIADLMVAGHVSWAWYAEGYQSMVDAKGACPKAPDGCTVDIATYPCLFDGGDIPFQYYPNFRDDPRYIRDLGQLSRDLTAGTLPQVVFIKGLGYHTEHPALFTTISDGVAFVGGIIQQIEASSAAASTLVLFTYDEGGGYFDHVAPPPKSTVDNQPYGTRVPMIAIGPFARAGTITHAVLEHSSIVKFIEWNWLGGQTGQLGNRDTVVNNLGSLLDPAATGTPVPEK